MNVTLLVVSLSGLDAAVSPIPRTTPLVGDNVVFNARVQIFGHFLRRFRVVWFMYA